jgi:hypothetical protein
MALAAADTEDGQIVQRGIDRTVFFEEAARSLYFEWFSEAARCAGLRRTTTA